MTEKEPNYVKRRGWRHRYTVDEKKELRRNHVRVLVTYAAAVYLFLFGPAVVICLFKAPAENGGNVAAAKDMFMSLLPIASSIVAYWFAARRPSDNKPAGQPRQENDSE